MRQHRRRKVRYQPCEESLRYMRSDRFRDLCVSLDIMEDDINGWTAAASKLGDVRPAVVAGIKRQSRLHQYPSTSTILLNSYFHFRQGDVLENLNFLSKVFSEIDNHEAKKIVEEEIRDKMHESKIEQPQVSFRQ